MAPPKVVALEGGGAAERVALRRALENALRQKGKLPELKEYEPRKKLLLGEPFSPETVRELAKLPGLSADIYELALISRGLDEPELMDTALQLAKLRSNGNGKLD
jgi:hypothetical protein